nr:hypothetical protein Iba_scaffold33228CG0010 [Ipomoea batatas]GMC81028.1 hypothetical protein Iba_scaffold63074CG0010 [Ipomoea batatas]
MVSANKGNCRNANNVTGRQATNSTGNTTHANCLLSTIEKLEPNATSIAVMERKSVASPKTNLFGNILVCSYAVDESKDTFLAVNNSNVENTLALLIHLPYQIRIRANELHNELNVP